MNLNNIFLAASVPLPERDRRFFDTADVLSIREAIKALVEVVLPVGRITCGGHPAITPLLSVFVRDAGLNRDRLTVFQSELFEAQMPPETRDFADLRIVPAVGLDRDASLRAMRREMVSSQAFVAAVVVGGMEGIFEEVRLFREANPLAPVLPIATTGAAAAILHADGNYAEELASELTYSSLFRRQLPLVRQTDVGE